MTIKSYTKILELFNRYPEIYKRIPDISRKEGKVIIIPLGESSTMTITYEGDLFVLNTYIHLKFTELEGLFENISQHLRSLDKRKVEYKGNMQIVSNNLPTIPCSTIPITSSTEEKLCHKEIKKECVPIDKKFKEFPEYYEYSAKFDQSQSRIEERWEKRDGGIKEKYEKVGDLNEIRNLKSFNIDNSKKDENQTDYGNHSDKSMLLHKAEKLIEMLKVGPGQYGLTYKSVQQPTLALPPPKTYEQLPQRSNPLENFFKCPNCGANIYKGSPSCPHCNKKF